MLFFCFFFLFIFIFFFSFFFFFFNDTATTEIYTLSLHDALPISPASRPCRARASARRWWPLGSLRGRSEEHTSELQSHSEVVCRLLLEKKKHVAVAQGLAPDDQEDRVVLGQGCDLAHLLALDGVELLVSLGFFFFNDPATTEIYTLSLHDALPISTGSMPHHPFLAMALVNFIVTRSQAIHINAGLLRPIDLVLPEASVVNAAFPAACGMRFTTAMRVHDLVLGALTQAIPGEVPVGGSGVLVVSYVSTSELGAAGRVVVANPVSGGSGASAERDGISGAEMSVAFLRNVPVEVL